MRKSKRILTLLLALLMITTLVPVSAFAEDGKSTIDVYYIDEDGGQVFEPYHVADIMVGSSFSKTVSVESVNGYSVKSVSIPPITGGTITQNGNQIAINISSMQADPIAITIVYAKIPTSYVAMHYKQNLNDDGYTLAESEPVASAEAVTVKTYEGFTDIYRETSPTNSDGTRVISIYYNRNNYHINFNLNGGYGVDNIYDRFGKNIGTVPNPTQPGYSFVGWTRNGESATIPGTVPAEDQTYSALWNEDMANYTVAYWRQNADDDGYTFYWAEAKSATTNSSVNGTAKSGGFTDAAGTDFGDTNKYFSFGHADQNVIVKADGTTIVNVYYDRELYQIDFMIGTPEQTIHVPAQPGYYEQIFVPGGTYAEIGGLTTNNVNYGTSTAVNHPGDQIWTPLYNANAISSWWSGNTFAGANITQLAGDSANTSAYAYGEKYSSNGNYHYVPLYNGTKVKVLEQNIAVKNPNNGAMASFKLNKVLAKVEVEGYKYKNSATEFGEPYTYTGYVWQDYLTNIQPPVADHYEDGPWHDPVEAHDETLPGKYYTRYAADLVEITPGDTAPSIKIPEGATGYDSTGARVSVSGTYYDKYTMYVRFGQDVKTIWPQRSMIPEVVDGLQFKCNYSKQNGIGETITDQYEINSQLLNQNGLGNPNVITTYYLTYANAPHKMYLRYRDLSDKTTDENGALIDYQEPYFAGPNSALNHRNFEGYAYVGDDGYGWNNCASYTDRYGEKYQLTDYSDGTNYTFRFTRKEYTITYHNAGDPVYQLQAKYKDSLLGTDELTKYQKTLPAGFDGSEDVAYNHTPKNPASLPDGAYTFAGWYADPNFQDEYLFDFDTTMPHNGIDLYAKWVPNDFTVIFLNEESGAQLDEQNGIPYDDYAHSPENDPSKDGYVWLGWFYKDADGEEHPFDVETTPIHRDMTVYGKWMASAMIEYRIHYVLQGNHDFELASVTEAWTRFDTVAYPKVGAELYPAYREGYFPVASSMEINVSQTDVRDFYFEYAEAEAVPYMVKYIWVDEDNNETLIDTKEVPDNRYSVVDEAAEEFAGYTHLADDPTPKRMVLVYESTMDQNVFYFYYEKLEVATFTVIHHAEDGTEDKTEVIPVDAVNGEFDLTTPIEDVYGGIREGYLYAGMYTDGDYAEPYMDENGKELTPEAGDVIYLREVSVDYLQPRVLSVRRLKTDTTVERYLITALDKNGVDVGFYQDYGFALDFDADPASDYALDPGCCDVITGALGGSENEDDQEIALDMDVSILYEYINVHYTDGRADANNYPDTVFAKTDVQRTDYLGCVPYDNMDFDNEDRAAEYGEEEYTFHFIPYFVTADNVVVSGTKERFVAVEAEVPTTASVSPVKTDVARGSHTYVIEPQQEQESTTQPRRMLVRSVFNAQMPQSAEGKITVTAYVEGGQKTFRGDAGDFTAIVKAPAVMGMRFVGWYADAAFAVPADLSNVTADTVIYGKYIDEAYFSMVIYNTVSKNVLTKNRVVTVVDNLGDYKEVGLIAELNGAKTTYVLKTKYSSVNSKKPQQIFGTGVSASSKLLYKDITVKDLPIGSEIKYTFYYVTQDGTTVTGAENTYVYNGSGMSKK